MCQTVLLLHIDMHTQLYSSDNTHDVESLTTLWRWWKTEARIFNYKLNAESNSFLNRHFLLMLPWHTTLATCNFSTIICSFNANIEIASKLVVLRCRQVVHVFWCLFFSIFRNWHVCFFLIPTRCNIFAFLLNRFENVQ